MKKSFVPKFNFHDKSCRAYNESTEIQKTEIGSTVDGPIIVEKEIVVDTYCSVHKKYDFDCSGCPLYKAKKREAGDGSE